MQSRLLQCNQAIRACREDWQQGLALLRAAEEVDVISYNSALSLCAWPWALAIFKEISERRLEATARSYGAALAACQRRSGWKEALLLLHELREEHLRGHVIVSNAASSACAQALRWLEAWRLLASVQGELEASTVSYNVGIDASSKARHWRQALWLQQELLAPSPSSYSALIAACEWPEATRVLRGLRREDLNIIVFNAAISACGARWQPALSFLRLLGTSYFRPTVVTYTSALASNWTRALGCFRLRGLRRDGVCDSEPL